VSYSNLATVLQDLGDYGRAKQLLEKAVISDEKNFGAEHPTTAVSYSNLASVLQDLGDYGRAKQLLEKAVISAEKNFGAEHPTTAVSYSNLASVLQDLGDYGRALRLSEKSVEIFKTCLPEGHPYIKNVCEIYDAIKRQLNKNSTR
jgi:tetratricopeptide (TPR) repeat protein